MTQQDPPTKKCVRIHFRWEAVKFIQLSTIKFAKHLIQPDFNFGFGSWSSKSSSRRVPRKM